MTDKSLLIIGAGIGGLSTGCYAQMNDYRVRILEMHDAPGGVCTAWRLEGYTFDGCIHNLAGSSPRSAFHNMWCELGVVPTIAMHAYEELVRVERPHGEPLTVHTNLDRLAAHMKQLAPADAPLLDELVRVARRFSHFDLMDLVTASPFERLKVLRMGPTLIKYGGVTMEQFSKRFTDPFLRHAFPTAQRGQLTSTTQDTSLPPLLTGCGGSCHDWPNSPDSLPINSATKSTREPMPRFVTPRQVIVFSSTGRATPRAGLCPLPTLGWRWLAFALRATRSQ